MSAPSGTPLVHPTRTEQAGPLPTPAQRPDAAAVARHYDELDYFYRSVWGEHLHHGLWWNEDDRTPPEEATTRLLEQAVAPLALTPEMNVVDIGCGYGGVARWLAAHHGVRVTGLTLSTRQAAFAATTAPSGQAVRIRVGDWLHNDLPDVGFQAALAIESLAHMPDKGAFFHELARTLVPGGRAALACWLATPEPTLPERLLLRQICREGSLPGIGTLDDYLRLARNSGLRLLDHRDISSSVERTWWIIARRVLYGLFTDPRYLRFLAGRVFRKRLFVLTIPRMILAYRTGTLRYGFLWLERPGTP